MEEGTAPGPSLGCSGPSATLTVEDLKSTLAEVFEDDLERSWVVDTWTVLIDLGFANYSNELERCEAAINFIAFAEFYRDWTAMVADEEHRDCGYDGLPTALDLSSFRVGQLIGRHPDFLERADCDECGDWDTDGPLFRAALFHLERNARPKIVSALQRHYGGPGGFFVALWNSDKQPRPSDYEQDRAEYESARQYLIDRVKIWEPEYQETADEALNDVTGEKMHLWRWLDQGAEPVDRC
jgi:hypothetical protein